MNRPKNILNEYAERSISRIRTKLLSNKPKRVQQIPKNSQNFFNENLNFSESNANQLISYDNQFDRISQTYENGNGANYCIFNNNVKRLDREGQFAYNKRMKWTPAISEQFKAKKNVKGNRKNVKEKSNKNFVYKGFNFDEENELGNPFFGTFSGNSNDDENVENFNEKSYEPKKKLKTLESVLGNSREKKKNEIFDFFKSPPNQLENWNLEYERKKKKMPRQSYLDELEMKKDGKNFVGNFGNLSNGRKKAPFGERNVGSHKNSEQGLLALISNPYRGMKN
jgi:hypothetical protein